MNANQYFEELNETEETAIIKAVKFELTRAEGLTSECGPAAPVFTWTDADNILRQWARTAPDEGKGYDKCDFTVTYADGETYTGRYDLKRHDMGLTNLLGHHIYSFVGFHAGTVRPEWMTPEKYQAALNQYGEETRKEYADFLAKYEIGDEQSKSAPVLVVTHDPAPEPVKKTTKQAPKLTKSEAAKVIEYRNIKNPWERDVYNVDVLPGKYIRLFGTFTNSARGPQTYDITFELGDQAEYGSYNLIYTGEIVSIGPKTVTIKHYKHSDEKTRLNIAQFANKNWNFDAERIADHNNTERMYI